PPGRTHLDEYGARRFDRYVPERCAARYRERPDLHLQIRLGPVRDHGEYWRGIPHGQKRDLLPRRKFPPAVQRHGPGGFHVLRTEFLPLRNASAVGRKLPYARSALLLP